MKKFILLASAVAVMAPLAACNKKAEGQVAAVVNGDEITVQEVNAEIGTTELPKGADKELIRKQALQRIIDRRLLAQVAKEDGIDKSAEYLIRRRTLDDTLLIQLLAKKIGSTIRIPTATKVDEFMKNRPFAFGDRAILSLDRIQFAMPQDPKQLDALKNAHSMDQVAAALQQLGIKFERGQGELDTARIDPNVLQQIYKLPNGEPFIVPAGNVVTAAVITGRRPLPMLGDTAKPVAANALRDEELGEAVQRRLKAATSTAKIEYQQGFAPPPKGAPTPKAAATPAAQ
ncbi:SurA N-terminal domain-containing protein [Sphingomonas floccifaciens]|uniref:SurA N-terminal domain-containing protein n=1 Tax=Sphingomonas floccifaciens TaxID=1844115 RepID=A0ABW4NHP5_9SPHN